MPTPIAGEAPATATAEVAGSASTARRPLTRSTKIGVAVVLVLSLLEAAALGTHYLLVSSRYVVSDNAQVDGSAIDIIAPGSGVLTRWEATEGSTIRARQVLGRIRLGGPDGIQLSIRSPGEGQVARTTVSEGQWVLQGTSLATAYDFAGVYVTARVTEDDIRDIKIGAPVDISVDAFPDVPMTGVVSQIQNSTAGVFTIYPNPEEDPTNPRPMDQYVPVRIAFVDTGNVQIRPGMNVTTRIHRRSTVS